MSTKIKIIEAERPETKRQEDDHFLRSYRDALTEISDILNLPGWPSLTTDVVDAVRRMAEENARLKGTAWIPTVPEPPTG